MIEISKPIIQKPVVKFTPRQGFKRSYKPFDLPLLYGHRCPTCGNVITAAFHTDRAIDLWPYESSVILSQGKENAGEILKVVPEGSKGRKYSQYNSEFFDCGPGKSVQRILMKNHVISPEAITERYRMLEKPHMYSQLETALWQVGDRPCSYACLFNEREDLAIKDLLVLFWISSEQWHLYNIPTKVTTLIPDQYGTGAFRYLPAIGDGPPAIMAERQTFINGYANTIRHHLLNKFKKD
jgi:hypothetical protein